MFGGLFKNNPAITPDMRETRGILLSGFGQALSQLGAGQPVNMSATMEALQQRKQAAAMRQGLEGSGVLDKLTPQQRAALAGMPESARMQILMPMLFPPTPEPVNAQTIKGADGRDYAFDPRTKQVTLLPTGAPPPDPVNAQTLRGADGFDYAFDPRTKSVTRLDTGEPRASADTKVVGGALVDSTGKVIYQSPEKPVTTDDITEYNMAVAQGYPGTLQDWIIEQRKASATNVNVGPNGIDYGDPGPGLAWRRSPTGEILLDSQGLPEALPYRGGVAWQKEQAALAKGASAGENDETMTDTVLTAARKAREAVSGGIANGPLGAAAAIIPSTSAAELRRQVDVLKANATKENLAAMRAESPTGGALGSISNTDLSLLASASGALDPNASAEDFASALDNYERTILRIIHGKSQGDAIFAATRPPPAAPPQNFSAMTPDQLLGVDINTLSPSDYDAYAEQLKKAFPK